LVSCLPESEHIKDSLLDISGPSTAVDSGAVQLLTGTALKGAGVTISLSVGPGDLGDGGDVLLTAGISLDAANAGGAVEIRVGLGASAHAVDGGDGGMVERAASPACRVDGVSGALHYVWG
jgi:hypothetical protein